MAGGEWFVTLDGVEQGPLAPPQVKELVSSGLIGPTTPIRRGGMERSVPAAQVKGLLPPEVVAGSGVGSPASVSERVPTPLTDSGAQRMRGSVPSTRRLAVATPEPDSHPVQRAERASEAATDEPDEAWDDGSGLDAGIERRASFGQRVAARLIDSVLIGAVVALFAGIGIWAGSALPGRSLAEIDTERFALQNEMPSYHEWEEIREQPLPEIPPEVEQGEHEEPEAFAQRKFENASARSEARYQHELWEFRDKRYQADRLRVEAAEQRGALVLALVLGLGLLLAVLVVPLSEFALTASPGKKMLSLGVCDADLRRIGLGKALARQFARLIPFGPLAALRANRLALHDQLTGTQVVPADQMRSPARKPKAAPRRGRGAGTARVARGGTGRRGR